MSRRPTALGLRAEAVSLLATLRDRTPPALGGELVVRLRRVVEEVDRAVSRAERDSAAAHDDGAPREADVAARLGVTPATLRRYRGEVRERELEELDARGAAEEHPSVKGHRDVARRVRMLLRDT